MQRQDESSLDRSLQRLARRLTANHHDAEDLVQETWLLALDSGRRRQAYGIRWFARTLRHLAIDRWRSVANDSNSLQEDVVADEGNSPLNAIERKERLRAVVAAVAAIHEPYRSVLELRFLRHRSIVETARSLGVPHETVRTRQRRGLALLRARLRTRPAARSGGGGALSALFFPRRRPGRVPASRPPGLLVAGTGFLGVMLLLVALVVGSGAGGGSFDAVHPGEPRVASTGVPLGQPPLTVSRVALARHGDPVASPPSGSRYRTLDLEARDPFGRGVGGAAFWMGRGKDLADPLPLGVANGSGELTATVDIEDAFIWVEAPGFSNSEALLLDFPDFEDPKRTEPIPLALGRKPRSLAGVLRSPDGLPMAGETLRIVPRGPGSFRQHRDGCLWREQPTAPTRTTEHGDFRFDGLGKAHLRSAWLVLVRDGFPVARWGLEDLPRAPLELVGPTLDPVEGKVCLPSGAVIPQGHVQAISTVSSAFIEVPLDSLGGFRLPGMAQDCFYLRAMTPYGAATLRWPPGECPASHDLVVNAGSQVSVTVLGPDGAPLAGWSVEEVRPARETDLPPRTVGRLRRGLDQAGSCSLPPASFTRRLRLFPPDATEGHPWESATLAPGARSFQWDATPSPPVCAGVIGRLAAPPGKPLPACWITLEGESVGRPLHARVGADGSFRFDDVPVGEFRLTLVARRAIFVPLLSGTSRSEGTLDLGEVPWPRGGQASFSVFRSDGSAPRALSVQMALPDRVLRSTKRSSDRISVVDGRMVSIEEYEGGLLGLLLIDGDEAAWIEPEETAFGGRPVVLGPRSAVRTKLWVQGSSGRPVQVTLTVRDMQGNVAQRRSKPPSGHTDNQVLTWRLAPGPYRIEGRSSTGEVVTGEFTVPPQEERTGPLSVVLRP